MKVKHTLSPIYNKNSEILILGSMPSKLSREKNFYYANKQNRFWKIMEELYNINFSSNNDKMEFLLKNNIALWDVFKEVDIKGSSDSSIKNAKINNLNIIFETANIKKIFCTGKKAYDFLIKNSNIKLPIIYLPSPSSANANYKLNNLIEIYAQIKE